MPWEVKASNVLNYYLDGKQEFHYEKGMNKLPLAKRVQILSMLCEGSSMRSISRVVDVSINSVTKLLEDAGRACARLHDETVRNVSARRVQCDEIWAFCGAKEKNTTAETKAEGWGDVWTWTALDADSKLMLSWSVGGRDADSARVLMDDLKARLANRVQLTTDGHKVYLEAVDQAFHGQIDYGMLVKIYGEVADHIKGRYSPAACIGAERKVISGNPKPEKISTSFVERHNLSIRMGMRRFTRLTNAHSKKLENHFHALSLYFTFYNFVRLHKTLRMSPAMAAGVSDRLWSMEDLAEMIEAFRPAPAKRGPYKPRKMVAADATSNQDRS